MTGTTCGATPTSLLGDDDLWLLNEGTHCRLWERLGAHPATVDGKPGCWFAVWAPDARHVAVLGDFNGWSREAHPLRPRGGSGVWEAFVPGAALGQAYKYRVVARDSG